MELTLPAGWGLASHYQSGDRGPEGWGDSGEAPGHCNGKWPDQHIL